MDPYGPAQVVVPKCTATSSAQKPVHLRGDHFTAVPHLKKYTDTGHIKVERVVAVHDCGRPINPLALDSQISGGVIQGISYTLFEDRILNQRTGRMVNPNVEKSKIAGAMERDDQRRRHRWDGPWPRGAIPAASKSFSRR